MFLLNGGPFVSSIFSSMAVKMVWKVLRAKSGYDLLHDFRYINSYLM